MEYENFYESLLYHIRKKGHGGQALVCRHTDIPRSYLSRIVKKGRRAGPKTQRKISRFFGLGLEEFGEIGRRITLGEDPESSMDLIQRMPEEHLLDRLTSAIRKEMNTSRQLTRTQLLYEDIVENSHQLIARYDRNLKISFVNRAFAGLAGRSRAELRGLPWLELVGEGCHHEITTRLAEFGQHGGTFTLEAPGKNDLQWLYLSVTIFPDGDDPEDKGQLVGFDITEQKKLVDRLTFIQHGVEMSFVPTLWIGDQANIVYVNQAVCDLLGYTREELASMHVWEINPLIPQESWSAKWAWFEQQGKAIFAGEYRTKTGTIIPVEFQVSNLKYPDGRRYNVVFVRPLAGS
ncbi:MAG: PAS domain S-box protein [Proteobacteria bacterium]|nr:PAS domain S-box protein [Pseudomonadota bacterium]MBU1687141.1 PAS domain S-box protein [Pseudomonadota bacterium]